MCQGPFQHKRPLEELDPSWGWDCVRAEAAWKTWVGAGDRVAKTVAVLDSGFDFSGGRWCVTPREGESESCSALTRTQSERRWRSVAGWDFIEDQPLPRAERPEFHHGTMVSGLIAQMAPNAQIMPLRWWREGAPPNRRDLIRAVGFAVREGAEIINLSGGVMLESADQLPGLKRAFERAARSKVLVVCSVHNLLGDLDDPELEVFWAPAGYGFENLITVTGIRTQPEQLQYDHGRISVDIGAPGLRVGGVAGGGREVVDSGASFATPFVSGAAALLWGMMPDLDVWQVRELILANAREVAQLTPGEEWGYTPPAKPNSVLDLSFVPEAVEAYYQDRLAVDRGEPGQSASNRSDPWSRSV